MMRDPTIIALGATVSLVVLGGGVMVWAHRVGTLGPALFTLVSRLAYGFYSLWTAGIGASDGGEYNSLAVGLAQSEVTQDQLVVGKESYPILLSWIYRMFGEAPEIGILVNCVVAAAVPTVVYLVCRQLGWSDAGVPAAWITALWPVGVFWQGLLLREAFVILLLAIALWGASYVRTGHVFRGVALLAATGFLMMGFRGGLAFIPLAVLPAALVVAAVFSGGMRTSAKLAASLMFVLLAAVSIPALNSLAQDAGYFDAKSLSTSTRANNSGTTAVSATGGEAGDGNVLGGIAKLPMATFGPYPWTWSNTGMAAAGLDGLLWLVGAVLAWIGVRNLRDRLSALLCVAPVLMLLVYIGAGISNFGLIMRMRGVGIPFLAPLAALGIVVALQRRRQRMQRSGDRIVAGRLSAGFATNAGNALHHTRGGHREGVGHVRIPRHDRLRPVR